MIKPVFFAIVTTFTIFSAMGQEKKDLVVSLSGGKLVSPYYLNNTSGKFYSFDFSYYLSRRHILAVNFIDGKHSYYDKVLSTNPSYRLSNGTNAKAKYQIFSILYKYKFLKSKQITAAIGTGAGIMTHSRLYPIITNNGSGFAQTSWSDLVFPVRLEVDFNLLKNFKLGVVGGFFVHPDFPILANHLGPRLSYTIK